MSIRSSKTLKGKVLEDLTKDELLTEIELMKSDIHKLKLQSSIYEEFLRRNDSKSLDGKERYIENMEKQYQQHMDSKIMSTHSSIPSITSASVRSVRRDTILSSDISPRTLQSKITLSAMQGDSKLEINKLYLIELIDHEMEERRQSLELFKEEFNASKFSLEAESECAKLHLAEVMDSQRQLDQFVAIYTDPLTGKIAADRYIKHIEQGLKKKDQDMRKMKLKTTALQREYRSLKSRQQQKLELMGRLHPIDIEKLKIENEELGHILDEKMRALYNMKSNWPKHDFNEKQFEQPITRVEKSGSGSPEKDQKLKKLEDENEYARSTVFSAEKENQSIKSLIQTYKAPQVLDYIKKKIELAELNSAVRVYDRRCKDRHLTHTFLMHKYQQMASDRKKSLRSPFKKTAKLENN